MAPETDKSEAIEADSEWFAVRSIIDLGSGQEGTMYEERITLWRAANADAAIARAEDEVVEYARDCHGRVASGLYQAFELFEPPHDGAEVFSLIRESQLAPAAYVTRFFDTGTELQVRE